MFNEELNENTLFVDERKKRSRGKFLKKGMTLFQKSQENSVEE